MSDKGRMPRPPHHETAQWLLRADEDIRAAELLLTSDSELIFSTAFHCQQAAEKVAKAALVGADVEYPKTHDVAEVGRLLAPTNAELGRMLEDLGGLTDWYIVARYPASDPDFMPSAAAVRVALDRLKALRERIRAATPKRDV